MKQFVKTLDKHGDCFNYIVKNFSGLSMENMKAGIFDGPQIRKLIEAKPCLHPLDQKSVQCTLEPRG